MRSIALLALLFLAGCGVFSKKGPDYACPKTGFVEQADRVTVIPPDPDRKGTGLSVRLAGFTGDCSYKPKTGLVEENLVLPFVARKGAAETVKSQQLSYFIAVLSPDEAILQRQAFTTTVTFDEGGLGKTEEEHTIKIPLGEPSQAFRYKVLVGFALTPAQLTYNKEH